MKRRKLAVGFLLVLLLAAVAWALMPARVDPQVAKVTALQQKLFGEGGPPSEERRQAFGEFRQEFEKLTDAQREKFMRDNPPPFMKQMQRRINDYFELPPEKRKEALDRGIDQFESRRKEMEKRFAQNGGRPGGGPPGGGPFGPPGGPGGMRNADPQSRNEMQKRMLDNTSPQQRAQMGEYMRAMADRRRERGLPPMPGPRF